GAVAADGVGDARPRRRDLAGPRAGRCRPARAGGGRVHGAVPGGRGGATGDLGGAPPARVRMTLLLTLLAFTPADAPKVAERPVELILEDQFGRKQDIAALRGEV